MVVEGEGKPDQMDGVLGDAAAESLYSGAEVSSGECRQHATQRGQRYQRGQLEGSQVGQAGPVAQVCQVQVDAWEVHRREDRHTGHTGELQAHLLRQWRCLAGNSIGFVVLWGFFPQS